MQVLRCSSPNLILMSSLGPWSSFPSSWPSSLPVDDAEDQGAWHPSGRRHPAKDKTFATLYPLLLPFGFRVTKYIFATDEAACAASSTCKASSWGGQ